MLKTLLLVAGSVLLAGATQAQVAGPLAEAAIRLPGEYPGRANATGTVARRGTVSQLQEALTQKYTVAGTWEDFSRNRYLRYRTPTLPGLIETDLKDDANWRLAIGHRRRYTTASEILSDSTDQYVDLPYGPYHAVVGAFTTPSQVHQQWEMIRLPGSPVDWDTLGRTTHTYNAAGQRTQRLEQIYFSGKFEDHSRHQWTYNSLGQVTVYEIQSAPDNGAEWGPLQRFTYTYNAAGKMQQFVAEIINIVTQNSYLLSSRHTLQYDGQGRESVITSEGWEDDAWRVESQILYAYDAAGDPVSATQQDWNGTAFQNVQRVLLRYQQVQALSAAAPAAGRPPLAVVPNPSAPDAPAQLLLEPGAASATGAVYDHLGRRVAELSCPPAQAARGFLPLPGNLPAGLYVVRLQAGARQWQARWDKR